MAVAHEAVSSEAPRPRVISPLRIEAELSCMMCGRVVADVVDGRIRQHAGCARRLAVVHGMLRCCHCAGPLCREPLLGLAPR